MVLAGHSIQHSNLKAVLKQFDLNEDCKAFKKELEVLAKIQLSNNKTAVEGLPELLGFGFSQQS